MLPLFTCHIECVLLSHVASVHLPCHHGARVSGTLPLLQSHNTAVVGLLGTSRQLHSRQLRSRRGA